MALLVGFRVLLDGSRGAGPDLGVRFRPMSGSESALGGVLDGNLRRFEQGLHGSCNADYVGCSSFDAGFSRAWNRTVLHPRLLDVIALCTPGRRLEGSLAWALPP